MKRKRDPWERRRLRNYLMLMMYEGDEAAAQFFPDLYKRFHPEWEPPSTSDSGDRKSAEDRD